MKAKWLLNNILLLHGLGLFVIACVCLIASGGIAGLPIAGVLTLAGLLCVTLNVVLRKK